MIALNNLFVLTPYQQGQGIRKEVRGGLALPGQKLNLVALELLTDTKIDGQIFKAGSKAYVAEDLLMNQPWAKLVRTAENVPGEFILVESRHVSMVSPKE